MERRFLSGGREKVGLEGGDNPDVLEHRAGMDTERGLL